METLNQSISIKASAAKVWQALTDAATLKQYFFGTNVISDWKKGSAIIWEGEWEGKTYQDTGKILDIDPGKYVKYSYWSSMSGTENKAENYAVISYTLTEDKGETTLTITQDNIKDKQAKEHSEQNWMHVFGKMKEMLESGLV